MEEEISETAMFLFTMKVPKESESKLLQDPGQVIIDPSTDLSKDMTDDEIQAEIKKNFLPFPKIKSTEQFPEETANVYDTRMNIYDKLNSKENRKKDELKKPMSYARVITNELIYGCRYSSRGLKQKDKAMQMLE